MAVQRARRAAHGLGGRVLDLLGRQEWIDRPSYRLENVLSFVFNAFGGARNKVTNFLNGVWLGHPVHPPLASLTTGAIGTTVALDALSLLPGKSSSEVLDASRFAEHALGLGILGNFASAATGVTDWQHTHEKDRRIGAVHGVLNLIATGLYIQSWRDRRKGRHLRGIVTSAVGYGITSASGFLGGALVFGSGIGMDQSGERLRIDEWTPVLPEAELPADRKLKRVDVDGVGVVVCRDGDEVSAFAGMCPHLAAPMEDGWVDRGKVVCPWHGSQFDVQTGEVVRGPAASPLPCYQARLRNGMVELRDGAPTPLGVGREKYLDSKSLECVETSEQEEIA
ncbi:Rieske 2Fe-2S domain-containing protein [Mycolicibacter sp. MYC123]|uniref:Rieske 2Fe-2S domain-containing protein n=1 Tax=[Mycobacterium] zoologicum TaxID=2872311 RepID=A0ABU5YGF1_9MYCO|nr:Rieske 2Fe-2S domain-containing protein [Mycolicibacter sp. MYC123]MEB3049141.1 Rieske 2Fe-2S domain-containing protein [Mycolicibacter sp. MYC123]